MKNALKFVSVLVVLVFCLSFTASAFAASIGFIDVNKVYTEYKEYKKVKDELKKKEDDYSKSEKEAQEKLDKAIEEKKSEIELKKLRDELLETLKPKGEEYLSVKKQLMDKINNDIVTATGKVSKKIGIDVVVDKVAVITGGVDLTNMVITELNK